MLRLLGLGPKPLSAQLKAKLPQINSFVDVVMVGGGPRGSVCVEALSDRALTIGALPQMNVDATGVFTYANSAGRFRFSARCSALHGETATFLLPERIDTLQLFTGAQQRVAVRLDATVPAQWRFAPGGKGLGELVRGSLTDISRSGASLIVDREVKTGSYVEARVVLTASAAPLVLLGEVMRSSPIETSKKISLGLRFHGLRADEDRAIIEFINKRQAERRSRGLA